MPWIRIIGVPWPRLVIATRRSRQSKPPSSPTMRFVSWSTPFLAKALYAAAAVRMAPPDRRIFRHGPSRSSFSSITPHSVNQEKSAAHQPQYFGTGGYNTKIVLDKKERLIERKRASGSAHRVAKNYSP